MTTCAKCGAGGNTWHTGDCSVWLCKDEETCALRAELRDVRAERDAAVVQVAEWCASAEDHRVLTAERDGYYGELSLLRAAVLEIAELARTTEGEDTGEFLAYRLREAVGK